MSGSDLAISAGAAACFYALWWAYYPRRIPSAAKLWHMPFYREPHPDFAQAQPFAA